MTDKTPREQAEELLRQGKSGGFWTMLPNESYQKCIRALCDENDRLEDALKLIKSGRADDDQLVAIRALKEEAKKNPA